MSYELQKAYMPRRFGCMVSLPSKEETGSSLEWGVAREVSRSAEALTFCCRLTLSPRSEAAPAKVTEKRHGERARLKQDAIDQPAACDGTALAARRSARRAGKTPSSTMTGLAIPRSICNGLFGVPSFRARP